MTNAVIETTATPATENGAEIFIPLLGPSQDRPGERVSGGWLMSLDSGQKEAAVRDVGDCVPAASACRPYIRR
jgi:hypothetical protein